jgi:hypothetical protein
VRDLIALRYEVKVLSQYIVWEQSVLDAKKKEDPEKWDLFIRNQEILICIRKRQLRNLTTELKIMEGTYLLKGVKGW